MAKSTKRAVRKAVYGDQQVLRGTGAETHQTAEEGYDVLTDQQGHPAADDQNSLKQGPRGPVLMEDSHFREKIFHFDHERIPERVVHARGYGAHGFFETYKPIPELTRADLFQREGERTPVFVDSRRSLATKGRLTWRATCEALLSSSIPRRETGTWSGITSLSSSSRTPSSSLTSSTRPNRNPIRSFRKRKPRMTTSGISSR